MVNAFKDFFWKYILIEDYQKSSKNLTSFLFPNSVSFYRNYCEKQKDLKSIYQSLFSLSNMSRRIFTLIMHYLAIIQKSFWVVLKITIANLCKLFHDIITVYKVSLFGIILVRILSGCGKMRTGITPNMDTFYALNDYSIFDFLFKYSNITSWNIKNKRTSFMLTFPFRVMKIFQMLIFLPQMPLLGVCLLGRWCYNRQ